MKKLPSSPVDGSVFALGVTAVALLISLVLRPYFEPDFFFFFLAATWVSAWFHGRTGGLIATGASTIAVLYFFLLPAAGTPPATWSILARLVSFVIIAALLTWVTAAWRQSGRMMASTLSSIADAVLATDRDGRINFLNPVAENLTGWPMAEAHGKPVSEVLRLIDEKNREPVENPLDRVLRDRALVAAGERTALVSRSGTETPIEHSASALRDGGGQLRGAILVFRDITKRRQLEEQATHAEKMDAVGRLAGGVAGDFNNLLTVITGYAELLRVQVPGASPLRRYVDEIVHAAERAGSLTGHLRAFSRGSTGQARVLDLNSVVSGMEPILRRLLGQDIELILLPSPRLGRVRADPAQIEQVVVNLVTNSREAMPHGGKVVIETANADLEEAAGKNMGIQPGSYVLLAVSDTGVGMDPATRSRLFEPFFTTKAPGKGSGLGLATVYGAIKQSEGQVTVYSQPDCGTIFEIYLPRVHEIVAELPRKQLAKGSETILLVDDEDGVRKLVHAVLKNNGYEVLEANNAAAALEAYEKNSHKIDMVLTDVVMPQMSGFELGRELATRAASLKILYMSGYRENAATPGEPSRAFLHKPFTPDVLLRKVREVLDAD